MISFKSEKNEGCADWDGWCMVRMIIIVMYLTYTIMAYWKVNTLNYTSDSIYMNGEGFIIII